MWNCITADIFHFVRSIIQTQQLCSMSDYKEIKLKDQALSINNNELTMTVDIEEVINQFTAEEIVDNAYNIEELYKILKKYFEG